MTGLKQGWEETTVENVTLRVDGLSVPACHARPDGMPKAGLVIAPDIGGVRPLFEEMARRLATRGIAVMAVEPFPRLPEERRAAFDVEDRLAEVKHLDDGEQVAALEAAADYLGVHDDVRHVSVLGFCMGGYYTFKAAAAGRFDKAVAFYGMIRTPEMWEGPGHSSPLDTIAGSCPTLAVFGGADPWSAADHIEALRDLWSYRYDSEIVVVEGAEHGFVHDPERPAYRPEDAAVLWERALAWVTP